MTDRATEPDPPESTPGGLEAAPHSYGGILLRLGPGLIIAGSIVGSGELIATTDAGAKAGFWLLWLIILGCVIKVFTQVELGRNAIISGDTTLRALNGVPGPRLGHANWLVWYWLIMFLVILGQQGGIVGSVGQALAISAPITEDGRLYNRIVDAETQLGVQERYLELFEERNREIEGFEEKRAILQGGIEETRGRLASLGEKPREHYDDRIWAALVTVVTVITLVIGKYGFIQSFATVLVAMFTLITIVNVVMLQADPTLAVTGSEFLDGLRLRLPPAEEVAARGVKTSPLVTALAAFGIIGVGASELIAYPYWCIEKGYARFTGPRDESPGWAERARGWMRVMRWDAWCSMVVYTFATVAFYLLGAATLGRFHIDAKGTELVRNLSVMFEPVFGAFAHALFLFGAIAVLYSTFFVAAAGNARIVADSVGIFGGHMPTEEARRRWTQIFSVLIPVSALIVYLFIQAPKQLVMASGVMQALMLPMLAVAALFFRYQRMDQRLAPSRLWDVMLWVSGLAMLVAGATLFYLKIWG